MKKNVLVTALFAVAVLFSNETNAQRFAPLDKSPMDVASFPTSYKISDKIVKVTYSRPQLKDRNITKLAIPEQIWRTGANEATEITFYKDVKFGGKSVDAGTYSLFTIPGEKEWIIILSTAKNVWGSYFYKETEDVVRVKAKVSSSIAPIEAFSMTFDDDMNLYMGWGYTVVKVTIK
ncbi:hypothetical protein KCTC32516_00939 [Polaribacter huanghezhanensis]|uniref:DUF2911 domain-containing protein n=1 Tax=Polaribacter huanghezhanensis TaxID=1354726 RepID=UPI0026487193|nr:DUF2911 domain-containing protein [Polaribacter huanghezhanensis]WKD85598.1 hypothetical protein KCTC32516_00939 [Polaribacter huanghezhanensis]